MTTHPITGSRPFRPLLVGAFTMFLLSLTAGRAAAQERLCDVSFEDCRSAIIDMIRAEMVGIDVSYWFMDDTRYSTEIIRKWQAGVPVRIMLDLRSDTNYPSAVHVRNSFINAGIPIRHKTTTGINHWKMILYHGQGALHFSAANFSNGSYSPVTPYEDYVDEAIYFVDEASDQGLVRSFMRKYDDLWMNTTHYANLANVTTLARSYDDTYPIIPELNFPPDEDYQDRLVSRMRLEQPPNGRIDIVMFRITSGKVPDEVLRRRTAGVPVRLITDTDQYRNTTYMWHSYNVDRMFMAGVDVKWKRDDAVTEQDMHQKSVLLYGQGMTVFGSSNWTSSSSDTQREHNYFTLKGWFFDWFRDQFARKWANLNANGAPLATPIYVDFVPGWPETPVNVAPANQALGIGTSVALRWEGGWWAHKYDIYFGTTNPPPLVASNYMPGSATAGLSSNKESFNPCTPPTGFTSACPTGLAPGTTYYWRVRGKTMVGDGDPTRGIPGRAITGPMWSFTTAGGVPPPVAPGNLRATGTSTSSVALEWDDVSGEQGYKVERKLAGASSTTWTQIGTPGADVTTFSNTGLTASTTYEYRVRAWTTGGNSAYSNIVTATTAAVSPETGRILADAYMRGGSYAGTNYGTQQELIAKFNTDPQYNRLSYLKLDIRDVPVGGAASVVLRLAGQLSDTRAPSVRTYVFPVSSSSWNETTLTWNNRPAFVNQTESYVDVSGTTTSSYELDLTAFINAQRAAGQTTISIALKNVDDTLPYVTFGSRESGNKPQLVITP